MQLRDSTVIVTGASSGIGLCIARALLREGARVAFAARSLGRLQRAIDDCGAPSGQAIAVPLDVTDDASVAAAVDTVRRAFGRIDVVVNNAGNGGDLGWWSHADSASVRRMFDVHVFGAERLTRAVLPALLEQRGGVVVNIASTVAWVPMPGATAYSAAKAAVVALSESLRAELRDSGIDVRIFSPPHTRTDSGRAWPLDLPKIFAPEWVAERFVRALRRDTVCATPGGNGALLFIQRVAPALATRIMNGLGFRALAKRQ